ncbi:MAG: hypothetical protein KF774_03195 [Planctomyces sp.]|nr:hypothetical protein [Planctomyces sp.]
MPVHASTGEPIVLRGLDGTNPLAFLAALGTLRALTLGRPELGVRMCWSRHAAWNPCLLFECEQPAEDQLAELLHQSLTGRESSPEFNAIGQDLTVEPAVFRDFARSAAKEATPKARTTADFAAAYGCDALTTEVSGGRIIQDTALRTMSGTGHQHFLAFVRNIIMATTASHIAKSLFRLWQYNDPVQNLTLRFDPIDDVRYALQWRDPSGDPRRKTTGSMLGANRLAIEGLPLLATAPCGTRLGTTGFRGYRSKGTHWTWPIWERPIGLDVVRTLLTDARLQQTPLPRSELLHLGVCEVFRSQRLTIEKWRNFTVGSPA